MPNGRLLVIIPDVITYSITIRMLQLYQKEAKFLFRKVKVTQLQK